MNKKEIKEYLDRVDELREKLTDEDKDTLEWLIFGYNQCAKLLYEKGCYTKWRNFLCSFR